MRKKFLIKPHLQIKHLFWILGTVLICFGVGYLLFESMLSSALAKSPLGPMEWEALRHSFRQGFFIGLVILLSAVGIENYFFFHRIAGPLFALERNLHRFANDQVNEETRIRDSDELRDLILSFEQIKKKILDRLEAQEKTAQVLSLELDRLLSATSAENVDSLRKKIKDIKDQVEKKAA